MDRKQAFSIAYGQRIARSLCTCGHSGDGAKSQHRNTVQLGHGACKVKGCACEKFSWASHTEMFKAKLAEVK
jgi:hypothetical protein